MSDIRRRTFWGLGWSGATQLFGAAWQFGVSIVLARLLSPTDFGLVGMVLVFTGFASCLGNMGLGASMVQQRSLSDRQLDSVFWASLGAGALLAVLLVLAAPLMADFYREPLLSVLTTAFAANVFLGSFSIVPSALLDRSLNFSAKFWMGSLSVVFSSLVAIGLALLGAGVWSLVAQSIALTGAQVVLAWRFSSWRPRLSFTFTSLKPLLRFGRNLLASDVLHYWGGNFDKLLIGRLLGSYPLGIYRIADKLMRLPLDNVTGITGAVMFPAFSAIQDNLELVKRSYLRATGMISLLTFPMMIGLSVLAEPAILAIYGDQWRGAVGIVQVLCFSGLAQSVYFTGGWIFLAQGKTGMIFGWSVYSAVVRAVGVLIGAHWGLAGVAWAYVLGTYVFICYPAWSSAGRLVNLGFKDMAVNLAGPLYCAMIMGALLWISDHWVFAGQPNLTRLAVQVPLGIAAYGILIRQSRLKAFEDLGRMIQEMVGGRSRLITWLAGAGN